MITLYDRYERSFATNGLGILEITKGVVEEELNGIFKFAGTYPLGERLSDKVTVGATLRVDTPLGQEPFRIWSINKTDGNIQIVAYHITFDLYYQIIEDKNLVTLGGQAALTRLLEGTPFTALSDVTTTASARVVRKSVQQAIFGDDENSFLPRWGGEFLRTGFTLNAKNFRGRTLAQNPVAIRYGKNLVSYETEIDESTYYNRIMPVGFNGLLLPEKYVNRVGIDLNDIRVQIVEYNGIKAIEDPANPREGELPLAQAEQALRNLVSADFTAGKFDPKVNHKIEFVDLSNTVEYENKSVLEKRYLGDEVRILNEDLLDVTARVISYQYDPITNEYISMELGNFQDKPMSIVGRLELVGKTVDELSTRQLTEQDVTILMTTALGGYVKELNGEMFVTNNVNPELATKVWRWNINGLGYSGTGINGPYTTAITMDGTILGSFLAVYSISTNQLKADVGQTLNIAGNTTITALDGRLGTAEQKITPAAITQTVEGNTTVLATKASVTLVDNAWKLRFDEQLIGGTNYFGNKTPLSYFGGLGWVDRLPEAPNGFVSLGRGSVGDTQGTVRASGLIDSIGKWTVSFWAKSNEVDAYLEVDIADSTPQGILVGLAFKKFIMTFDTTMTGFVDFSGLQYKYYYIKDLKIEKGTEATDWSPHPDELYAGIVEIDEDGIRTGISTAQTYTEMAHDGFRVKDGEKIRVNIGDGGSFMPELEVTSLRGNVLNTTLSDLILNVGSGQAFSTINQAINSLRMGKYLYSGGIININLTSTIYEDAFIEGFTGSGRIKINLSSGVLLHGTLNIINCTPIVEINGGVIRGNVQSINSKVILGSTVITTPDGAGYGLWATDLSVVRVTNVDFSRAYMGVASANGSIVILENNRGNPSGYSYGTSGGGILYISGTKPVGAVYGDEGHVIYRGTPTDLASLYTPPTATPTPFTAKFSPIKLQTYIRGTSTVAGTYGSAAAQGKSSEGSIWAEGRITFGTDVAKYFAGGTNTSVRMRLHRKDSSHGLSAACKPDPDNFSPTTWPTGGALQGGWSDWATISSAEFSTTVNKEFRFYSGVLDSGYSVWDDCEVEVTVTKNV